MEPAIIAIDLAKRDFQIHYVEPDTGAIHSKVLKRAQLVPFFFNRPASRVVMEACGSAHHWARVLARLGHNVRLIAAQFVRPFVKSNFGPILACEKLRECHGIRRAVEIVRTLMTAAGLWVPRKQRPPSLHQPRDRRACLGELIQIDGSEHHWFEERAPQCTLLVFIDDAAGRLMTLHFTATELTFSYFEALSKYLRAHGKPKYAVRASPGECDRRANFGTRLSATGRPTSTPWAALGVQQSFKGRAGLHTISSLQTFTPIYCAPVREKVSRRISIMVTRTVSSSMNRIGSEHLASEF